MRELWQVGTVQEKQGISIKINLIFKYLEMKKLSDRIRPESFLSDGRGERI